jgi:hypothetical protein
MLNLFSNYLEIIQVRQREYRRLQFNNESNRLFTYYQKRIVVDELIANGRARLFPDPPSVVAECSIFLESEKQRQSPF